MAESATSLLFSLHPTLVWSTEILLFDGFDRYTFSIQAFAILLYPTVSYCHLHSKHRHFLLLFLISISRYYMNYLPLLLDEKQSSKFKNKTTINTKYFLSIGRLEEDWKNISRLLSYSLGIETRHFFLLTVEMLILRHLSLASPLRDGSVISTWLNAVCV